MSGLFSFVNELARNPATENRRWYEAVASSRIKYTVITEKQIPFEWATLP